MENAEFLPLDLWVGEVYLVHADEYRPGHVDSAYAQGRRVSGLVYVRSGQAIYRFPDRTLRAEEGSLLFLPADCAYTVAAAGAAPFSHYTANFSLLGEVPEPFRSPLFLPLLGESGRAEVLFAACTEAHRSPGADAHFLCKSALYRLLGLLVCAHTSHRQKSGAVSLLAPAVERLRAGERADGETLAALCHLSETHFRRLFTAAYGVSPLRYRNELLVARGKELLAEGTLSVKEVAFALGFSDPGYFSRLFHRIAGIPPEDYRKMF